MINEATAVALILAAKDRIDVDPLQVGQVEELLRASGRYGSEATEVVEDVLAALHVVQHGAKIEDFPHRRKGPVSAEDITRDNVLAAIRAGHDDIFKLAECFDVPHTSFTLRRVVFELADAKLVRVAEVYGEPNQITATD